MTILAKKYGWKRQQPDERDLKFDPGITAQTILPTKVDLRTSMPPIYDQGDLGSCTANAIAGLMAYKISQLSHVNFFTPSRLFIYYNERSLEGTVNQDAGALIRDGMKTVNKQGAASETIWPYNINQFKVRPSTLSYTDGLKHVATQYLAVEQDLTHIKTALAANNPVVFGFIVYQSFESNSVAINGIVPMPGPHEQELGGHAVLIVGYDDSRQWYIVRNSWGTNWGANGYCFMPYNYVNNANLADDFWTAPTVSYLGL